ncbi:MAG TPA: hypothetical protein VFR31_20910 [Thermoanaerobaculia bacterium]|nr:hypothetical protein [Thermoanaerobaculia bacterium]
MRDRVVACALAAGLLVLLAGPPAGAQPVATLGEWSVLALDGGLFFVLNDQDTGDVDYVYAYTINNKGDLRAVSAEDGDDLELSVESLAKTVSLSNKDLATLKVFTDTQSLPTDGKAAGWKAASYDEVYQLLAQSDVGLVADVMLETLASRWSGNAGAVAVDGGYCKAGTFIDSVAVANESAAAQVAAASSMTFGEAVAATCASIFPRTPWPPAAPPAWPVYIPPATAPPGWTPPAGPGAPVWVGSACTLFGMTSPCVNSSGELCTCSCQGAGATGIWVSSGGCTTIPSNATGTPCTPAGGLGPCGNQCCCNCVAPPAPGGPPGSGTWGPTIRCGSEEAAWGLLAMTALCGVWFARRSRRTATSR